MIKKLQALKAKKGFTLVELIVVIAIIGVLAAILVPTMLNMVTKSRVTSANSTAKSIKNQIDEFLTDANNAGYGLKTSKTVLQTLDITITTASGVTTWSCTAATGTNFKTGNGTSIAWGAAGTGTSGATKAGVTKAEDLLCIMLAERFPDMKSGAIKVSLRGDANVVALAYTADQNTALTAAASASASGDCPPIDATTGEFVSPYQWDTKTAGVSDSGLIVGTAPEVALG